VLPGMSHDKYDWKIAIYRVGHGSADYVRCDTNDTSLNDWKGESTAEEVDYLPNDDPQTWFVSPTNFGFDVRNYHWAAIGVNPAPGNKDLTASPHCDLSLPRRSSNSTGTAHDFVVVNGSTVHGCPYYASLQTGPNPASASGSPDDVPTFVQPSYLIEAENDPPDLTIGTRLSSRRVTAGEVFDLYQVRLYAGHKYMVNVSQSSASTANLSVFLFKPKRTTGSRLSREFYRNGAGVGGSETLTFTANYSGRWGILVSNENGGAGVYSIKVTRVN
jgi:hypothetical protein